MYPASKESSRRIWAQFQSSTLQVAINQFYSGSTSTFNKCLCTSECSFEFQANMSQRQCGVFSGDYQTWHLQDWRKKRACRCLQKHTRSHHQPVILCHLPAWKLQCLFSSILSIHDQLCDGQIWRRWSLFGGYNLSRRTRGAAFAVFLGFGFGFLCCSFHGAKFGRNDFLGFFWCCLELFGVHSVDSCKNSVWSFIIVYHYPMFVQNSAL